MTPTMTPIARPSRVFLVESGWQYFLAWKDGTQLLWTHAGVTLDDRQPSFAETGIDAPPTEASMSNDLRSCSRFAPIEPLRVWDVTDHLGPHEKYIVNPFDTGAWRIEKLFAGF